MEFKDEIIYGISKSVCEGVSRKVILKLQKMTEGMQSGDDSPLKNIWDEICVQVQHQESIYWSCYEDVIFSLVQAEVKQLETPIKQAIWFQTEWGFDWICDSEDDESLEFCEEDCEDEITEYLLSYVIDKAADWSNRRIEKYLWQNAQY